MTEIKIIRKNIKNINLRIKPNADVILSAPFNVSKDIIDNYLNSKKEWIKKHQEHILFKNRYKNIEYENGDVILFKGKEYTLKNIVANKESVELFNGYIYINVKESNLNNKSKKEAILYKWYKDEAVIFFSEIIHKFQPLVSRQLNGFSIRKMKSRWGSCNVITRNIVLNIELVKQSIDAVEYVVLHEMAHFFHYNHDKSFYQYIEERMPDWKSRKNKLTVI